MRSGIEPADVRAALERLLSSKTFSRSAQLRKFLEYTVGRKLEEPKPSIKEYTIAIEVFGRPASYDPRADPIVRTEALRLRRKLARYYESEGRDETVRIGYPKGSYVPQFVANGKPTADGAPVADEVAMPTAVVFWPSPWLVLAILGASLVALTLLFLRSGNLGVSSPRVGVLPFEDLSPEQANDDFALAMSHSILEHLADIENVDVASRTSLYGDRTGRLTPSQIATALRADYLIGGTIVKSDESFQVTTRLIRARDDREVWTRSFDFSWPEIFEAQQRVARDIAEQLLVSEVSLEDVTSTNLAAYEAYVKARYSVVQFMNTRLPTHFEEAQRRLTEAIEIDPELADAWAELGRVHYGRLFPPRNERTEVLAEAENHLTRALAIDPSNAIALQTLGLVYAQSGRPLEGIDLCRRVIETDPKAADGHDGLGQIYLWLGFYESALTEFDAAIEDDPLYLSAFLYKVFALSALARWEEALATAQLIEERFPDIPGSKLFLGDIYFRMGDLERAETIWQEGYESLPEAPETSYYEVALALTAAAKGNVPEGRRVLDKFRGTPFREQTHLTDLAASLGDTDYAVERIAGHPQRNYRWLLSRPNLAALADDPSFAELTRTLHKEWRSNLEALRDTLPVSPPELPAPEEFLTRPSETS